MGGCDSSRACSCSQSVSAVATAAPSARFRDISIQQLCYHEWLEIDRDRDRDRGRDRDRDRDRDRGRDRDKDRDRGRDSFVASRLGSM